MKTEMEETKTLQEGATSFVKEDTPLTYEEKVALSAKTGYGISSIDKILRGSVPVLPRHQQLIELYKNILQLKELYRENYKKELKELVSEDENEGKEQAQQSQNLNQMTDIEILKKLREAKVSLNKISKATHISNSTLKNYVDGKTKPTTAKLLALKAYFWEENGSSSQNTGNIVVEKDNNGNIDNRQYCSDSPGILRATIELLEERIREKDTQIREKDTQIKDLHEIIKQLSQK